MTAAQTEATLVRTLAQALDDDCEHCDGFGAYRPEANCVLCDSCLEELEEHVYGPCWYRQAD